MLKYLRIQNLILVDEAAISFNSGLNIITGETGSGKSALIHALNLVLGSRADTSMVRKGCDKGVVEAVFDVENHSGLLPFLNESGIDHEQGQELIIRRELFVSGKGRIFINHQLSQAAFLRTLSHFLCLVVEQAAHAMLLSLDYHRHAVDLFGDNKDHLQTFQRCFERELSLKKNLEALIQAEAQRMREIAICERECEELEEAGLKPNEDEELFSEYTLLFHAEELAGNVNEILTTLSGEKQNALASLSKQKSTLDRLLAYDANLKEPADSLSNALLELQEVFHTLRRYQSRLNVNPERLHSVNERLALLNRLKKKYGSTIQEMLAYHAESRQKLDRLKNTEEEMENMSAEWEEAKLQTNQAAKLLTEKRKASAAHLESELTHQVRTLNMPKALIKIVVQPQVRNGQGDDKVEIHLQANTGEPSTSLREGSSGGEISRVQLALQTLLAGKEQIPTLIFDEIDSNIGGETATIVGNKLKEIGEKHQVICITHFPQVAESAHAHFQIAKIEREGRTFTEVIELDNHAKTKELHRMAGIRS